MQKPVSSLKIGELFLRVTLDTELGEFGVAMRDQDGNAYFEENHIATLAQLEAAYRAAHMLGVGCGEAA